MNSDVTYSEADDPIIITSSANVTCYLVSDETDATARQKDFSNQELLVRAALSYNFRDLVLMHDDGTPSSVRLLNAGSITGVRITNVSAPEGSGTQFAGERTVTFVATAQYEISPGINYIVSYQEQVSYIGNGGPTHTVKPSLDGLLVPQILYPVSPYRATQSGQCIALLARPNLGGPRGAAIPRFPGLINDQEAATLISPIRRGFRSINYGVAWNYQFLSQFPFLAYQPEWGA